MTWVRDTIIEHPEIAVFLALGSGSSWGASATAASVSGP